MCNVHVCNMCVSMLHKFNAMQPTPESGNGIIIHRADEGAGDFPI